MKENNTVFIGLGSNLGNREENLSKAIQSLEEFIEITDKSLIYESEPVGKIDQDWFLNMVVTGKTSLSPEKLLNETQKIEQKLKKKKIGINGPRTIDIDMLFYNNLVINSSNLIIPHPRLQGRKFVLEPLSEIAPSLMHPTYNKSIKEILKNLNTTKKVTLWTTKT